MPERVSNINVLTLEDVLKIHEALVRHFDEVGNPICPPGARDINILASAVSRQTVGTSDWLKYAEPRYNAVSLMYGLCMNHPFHNGNKRTALVAFLAHLNANGYVFKSGVHHKDLYHKILELAAHRISIKIDHGRHQVEEELSELLKWAASITRRATSVNHPITFRKLKQILTVHGFYFDNFTGGFVDINKDTTVIESGFLGFRKKEVKRKSKITQIVYRGDGMTVEPSTIKMIRRQCGLTEDHGVDSQAFYNLETATDWLISGYSNILKKLANK
ncbi:MAG: Fic family protein [Elusimicrobiales bacterium]|nr:Fic family protein [Elusimicrobiales bacterium]